MQKYLFLSCGFAAGLCLSYLFQCILAHFGRIDLLFIPSLIFVLFNVIFILIGSVIYTQDSGFFHVRHHR